MTSRIYWFASDRIVGDKFVLIERLIRTFESRDIFMGLPGRAWDLATLKSAGICAVVCSFRR